MAIPLFTMGASQKRVRDLFSSAYFVSAVDETITALPSHNQNDIIFAVSDIINTIVSPPAGEGWNLIFETNYFFIPDTNYYKVWFKIAPTNNSSLGTWSGANPNLIAIYRGFGYVGASSHSYEVSARTTWPALTLQKTDGTSLVVAMATYANASDVSGPTGYVKRFGGTNYFYPVYDSGIPVSSFVGGTLGSGKFANGVSVFELLKDRPPGIQFVGGATAVKDGATTGNSTIPLNSGLTGGISDSAQSGDFVIAVFANADVADRTLSISDGTTEYTLIADLYANSTADVNLRVAYKFITADTATTFGPTLNASGKGTMAVYVFRNVNVTTPLDVAATTSTSGTTRIANPPSITPITAGAYIVALGAGSTSTNGGSYSSSDLINFFTAVPLGLSSFTLIAGSILGIGHKADWLSGAFDPAAFTLNGIADSGTNAMCATTIALRPQYPQ